MVSGILSIVLSGFVVFQSGAAGMLNALEGSGEVSGTASFLVALLLLAGGIVSIVSRKGGKGKNIAVLILYGLGALLGFTMAGNYSDLRIWAGWCLICALLAVVALVKGKQAAE